MVAGLAGQGVTHVVNCRPPALVRWSGDLAAERAAFGPERVAHAPMADTACGSRRGLGAGGVFRRPGPRGQPQAGVLIHCTAGRRRSAMLAYAVLRLRGTTPGGRPPWWCATGPGRYWSRPTCAASSSGSPPRPGNASDRHARRGPPTKLGPRPESAHISAVLYWNSPFGSDPREVHRTEFSVALSLSSGECVAEFSTLCARRRVVSTALIPHAVAGQPAVPVEVNVGTGTGRTDSRTSLPCAFLVLNPAALRVLCTLGSFLPIAYN